MKSNYEKHYHEVERNYWIFKSMRELILDRFNKLNIPKSANIVELGCSSGILLEKLKENNYKKLTGVEISAQAIKALKSKDITGVKVKNYKLPFKDNSIDVLIASNILEHIESDSKAIKEWRRVIKKEGHILIIVPAFMALWSEHDEINLHFKRYRIKDILKLAVTAQLTIREINYWNFVLFIPVLVIRKILNMIRPANKKSSQDQLIALPNLINKCLINLLNFETYLTAKHIKLPFGVSIYCHLKK